MKRHGPIILCRPGAEAALAEEWASQAPGNMPVPLAPGVVAGDSLPKRVLCFERQRLPKAWRIPNRDLKPFPEAVVEQVFSDWLKDPFPFALLMGAQEGLDKRLQGLERQIRKQFRALPQKAERWERKANKLFVQSKGKILQLWLCDAGLLLDLSRPGDLSSAVAGGEVRMRFDPDAPSRSYLKMEEALTRMGVDPVAGEQVIDLGAAPGGWTYAFLKRDCDVATVDNGSMRIPDQYLPQLTHLQQDGMRFQLNESSDPIDWLVGDMLVPPGKAWGLLRYWLGQNKCRRIILNIKVPQQEMYVALEPILEWLEEQPGWNVEVRQLFHDRREVTVMGYRDA